ncbi:hypothetical protein V4S32_13580 [Enterococcus cecorum]
MDFRELDALKCKMDQFRPLTKGQVEAIEREKKIEHVWSSNALEGGTLDKYETATILETGATIHATPVKEILETLDLGKAFDFVYELALGQVPLNEEIIQKINQLVTIKSADKVELAGMYRLNARLSVWCSRRTLHRSLPDSSRDGQLNLLGTRNRTYLTSS